MGGVEWWRLKSVEVHTFVVVSRSQENTMFIIEEFIQDHEFR